MSSTNALVAEPTARKISPVLFLLALICFVLPFASVSCNTDKAAQAAAGLSGLGDSSSTGSTSTDAGLTACLNSLKGVALVTYSGLNLVMGSNPTSDDSKLNTAACSSANGGSSGTSNTATNAADANVGFQILAVLAALAAFTGLVVGALKHRMRGVFAAALAVVAVIFLFIENSHLSTAIGDKLASSAGSGGATSGVLISEYFTIGTGIGLVLAALLLAVAAAYNLAAHLMGQRDQGTAAAATPTAPPPPPPAPSA